MTTLPEFLPMLPAPGGLKMLRETLCVAQGAVSRNVSPRDRRDEHVERLQALLRQVDALRPLGPDGKHGDLHTSLCGCEV